MACGPAARRRPDAPRGAAAGPVRSGAMGDAARRRTPVGDRRHTGSADARDEPIARLLAAERGHSVLVVGPTQSRKTSGLRDARPSSSGRARWSRRRSSPTSPGTPWRGVPEVVRSGSTTPRRRRASPARHGRRWRRRVTWEGARRTARVADRRGPIVAGRARRRRLLVRHRCQAAGAAVVRGGGLGSGPWPTSCAGSTPRRSTRYSTPWWRRASTPPCRRCAAAWGRDERQRSAVYTHRRDRRRGLRRARGAGALDRSQPDGCRAGLLVERSR